MNAKNSDYTFWKKIQALCDHRDSDVSYYDSRYTGRPYNL
jgi:hypothetical protein